MPSFSAVLVLQSAVAADTVLFRQVPAARSTFEQLVFVASGLTSILTVLLVVVVLLQLIRMRAAAQAFSDKLDQVLREVVPLTRNANAASADVRESAAMAKAMVLESRETVSAVNARVHETIENLTDRVDDLAEMLGRIHRAAERIAGVAGTAMGGLKAGAALFGMGRKKKPKAKPRVTERDRPRLRRRD
jgi:hypothetical protein